jgi:hypothetical protein
MSDKADKFARHLSDYCIYLVKGVDAGDDGDGGRCGVSYRSEEVSDEGKGGEPGEGECQAERGKLERQTGETRLANENKYKWNMNVSSTLSSPWPYTAPGQSTAWMTPTSPHLDLLFYSPP